MRPSTVLTIALVSPLVIVGGAIVATGLVLFVSAEAIRRATCSHDWKYVGFWRDRQDGEYERRCKSCGTQEWTNEVDKNSMMYKVANLEME